MTPKKARAIWAIYVWCRRTDELVDGPNASRMNPRELDRWEERLEELFDGRPYDVYDAALTATVSDFPVSIQPFRDMVGSYSPPPASLPLISLTCYTWLGAG